MLQNAAAIEPEDSFASISDAPPDNSAARKITSPQVSSASDPPPPVEIAVASESSLVAALPVESAVMPTLDVKVSQGIKQGSLIHGVQAVYPPQARVQRLSGSVVVDATIGEDGAVRNVKIISGPRLLAAAATDAIRQWRYSPALLNGTPIEVQKRITVVFKLP
jgi:protein TonB